MDDQREVDERRSRVEQLRDSGLRRRVSLESRGELLSPATSPLGEQPLGDLNAAIDDPDAEVRRLAVKSAGDLGDESSIDALLRRLQDEDENARIAAVISLGDIGGPRAVGALVEVLRERDEPEALRLAALTELEELAAKKITSGPDRRFDPPEERDEGRRSASAEMRAAVELTLGALRAIEGDDGEAPLMRLKARDVCDYIESGAY